MARRGPYLPTYRQSRFLMQTRDITRSSTAARRLSDTVCGVVSVAALHTLVTDDPIFYRLTLETLRSAGSVNRHGAALIRESP